MNTIMPHHLTHENIGNFFNRIIGYMGHMDAIVLYGTTMTAHKNIFKRFSAGIRHVNAIALYGTAVIAHKNIFKGFPAGVR